MKLGTRLKQLDSMIPKGYDHIWDCCCDHGLLGMSLLRRNAAPKIHFVDIVPNLIQAIDLKLPELFPKYPQSTWQTHCLDVTKLPINQHSGKHLIIIAGVGGDETIKLVNKLFQQFSSFDMDFLLCPVYHQYSLRKHLIALNFSLLNEALIKERKQFYEILYVSSGAKHGERISPGGSAIWKANTLEEFQIAKAYLERTLAHYRKSERSLGKQVEEKILTYQDCEQHIELLD